MMTATLVTISCSLLARSAEPNKYRSHPPLRSTPPPSQRPLGPGPKLFVDPGRGDDKNDGSEKMPWRSVNAALKKLKPGDTLCLRGGTYFENIYCAVAGTKDAPITIRSYPGEQAVIDGGLREFAEQPASCWTPVVGGAAGEFRTVQSYRNLRDVVGRFGDSLVGLQTYWHLDDLRATNELWIDDPEKKRMVLPHYCGPGLWYDKSSGHIHVRLAHTHLNVPDVPDYRGETDPRRLPLIVAPFNSVPLFVDQAMHVRFQDLVIQGGGFNTVVLQNGVSLEFDGVTIHGSSYAIRARGTGPLRMVHCGVYGMIPPWAWRSENSLFTYNASSYDPFIAPAKPANERNIARLPTHALVVTEGSYEFEIFYYPYNHDWDISYSEFGDGHDGVYLSGHHIHFHHNLVNNMQDDGIYLSAPSPYMTDDIHVEQNLILQCFTAFACNSIGGPDGRIDITRNVVDLRQGVNFDRPTPQLPRGRVSSGHIFLTHGREHLGNHSLYFYQNTFLSPTANAAYALRTWVDTMPTTQRRVFNNIFVYLDSGYPPIDIGLAPPAHDLQIDGNLHWSPTAGAQAPADFLAKVRASPASERNKKNYPAGWAAHDRIGDPLFMAFDRSPKKPVDYRLKAGSAALAGGVALPADWHDPLRPKSGPPDIGGIPAGAEPPRFGRQGRLTFPLTTATVSP
jgi:hypothetical protein